MLLLFYSTPKDLRHSLNGWRKSFGVGITSRESLHGDHLKIAVVATAVLNCRNGLVAEQLGATFGCKDVEDGQRSLP